MAEFVIVTRTNTKLMAEEFVRNSKHWSEPLTYADEKGLVVALTALLDKAVDYANRTQQHNIGEDRRC